MPPVPLCWLHLRAYDTGRLELLPRLEPRSCAEVALVVVHLGLIGAVSAAGAEAPLIASASCATESQRRFYASADRRPRAG